MRRFEVRMTLQPTGFLDRLWGWRCRTRPAFSEALSKPLPGYKWARLVPMSLTGFHQRYAGTHGLHWGPCVLCMRPYGGHQSAGGVPDPTQPPPAGPLSPVIYIGICPRCTRRRKP